MLQLASSHSSFPTFVCSMMGSLESCSNHNLIKMINQNNYLQKAILQPAYGLTLDPLFTDRVPTAVIQTCTILIPLPYVGIPVPRSNAEVQACAACAALKHLLALLQLEGINLNLTVPHRYYCMFLLDSNTHLFKLETLTPICRAVP